MIGVIKTGSYFFLITYPENSPVTTILGLHFASAGLRMDVRAVIYVFDLYIFLFSERSASQVHK